MEWERDVIRVLPFTRTFISPWCPGHLAQAHCADAWNLEKEAFCPGTGRCVLGCVCFSFFLLFL
jgi:hypothetical protein